MAGGGDETLLQLGDRENQNHTGGTVQTRRSIVITAQARTVVIAAGNTRLFGQGKHAV